jgi:hypothetical protein
MINLIGQLNPEKWLTYTQTPTSLLRRLHHSTALVVVFSRDGMKLIVLLWFRIKSHIFTVTGYNFREVSKFGDRRGD